MGKNLRTKVVGMDVHQNSISIALADDGPEGAVRLYGTIRNFRGAIDKVVRKLVSTGAELHFVYEAGPCGFALYRHLTGNGFSCIVAAPSMIPRKSGVRIKNDTRDAIALARLLRAGELTPIYVPDTEDEAMRDLTRARNDARIAARKAKQRLHSFLLRNECVYPGKTKWIKTHLIWLAQLTMKHPAQQVALQEYIEAVNECTERITRLDEQILKAVDEWRWAPTVKALQALRGVSLLTAVNMVAEIGDFNRFHNPKELMAYLGLVPSEHSSGARIRRGGITKTGNSHARRICVESAWSYRYQARVTQYLRTRHEGLPKDILQIAWKAQLRLCTRYRRLRARGKATQVVVVAIARELVAFMWDIARRIPAVA